MIIAVRDSRKGANRSEPPVLRFGIVSALRDEMLADASSRAVDLAPAQRQDLLTAQAACSSLLTAVEMDYTVADHALIEAATLIRDHLGALIDSTERRLLGETTPQRDTAITEMVKYLLAFGDTTRRNQLTAATKCNAQDTAIRSLLDVKFFQRFSSAICLSRR